MRLLNSRSLAMVAAVGAASLMGSTSALAQSQCDAVAGNLVANCGFESGSFSSWTTNLNADAVSGSYAHSGSYGWQGGTVGFPGTIQQTITTTMGNTYNFSIWFQGYGGTPNEFYVNFDGNDIVGPWVDHGSSSYTQYFSSFVATGSSGVLTIGNRQDPAYDGIDDIVVTDGGNSEVTPEPASLVLLGTGLVGVIGIARRRKSA